MTPQDANNQDAYWLEQEKLTRVIQSIEAGKDEALARMPARAALTPTADAIQSILQKRVANLESALQQPYFGRVDYLQLAPQAENSKTIYVGRSHIPDEGVVSWMAPISRLWYTNESSYTAPYGQIRVSVDLKRFLRIRGQQIVELNDIYRRALPEGSSVPNPALSAALSTTADDHLSEIIETIEPDQYENIANVSDRVLVVQGAAGSGKSEIGLHRIAFLLSPFNELPENQRPTPSTTLFIGPSRSFLEYAADVLPNLGVQENVQQITLREWIDECQSAPVKAQSRIWNNLQDSGRLTRFNETAEAFKGSMAMADTLDRHVRNLVERVRKASRNLPMLVVDLPGQNRFTVSHREIQSIYNDVISGATENPRLNARRRELADRITTRIASVGGSAGQSRGNEGARRRRHVEAVFVNPWLNRWWPQLDFRDEYAALLTDPENLAQLSRGAISLENARSLLEPSSQPLTDRFEDSDLGALTYLDHLLNDTIRRRYQHIVVDEAQDISPIELRLLRLGSVNNWFTILGDTAQRLTPHRGIRRWGDIKPALALGRSAMKVQHARTSYRSNKHITRFNNRILRQFDRNIDAPIPYEREGHRVEFHRHTSSQNMYRYVVSELERIRSLDNLTNSQIAILVRDGHNLREFQSFCKKNGIDDVAKLGSEVRHLSTVLARIPEAKGLEFDAVIVIGVNDAFTDTIFNQKLLYVAATRAKHYLAIHWARRHSPIIRAVSHRGVRKFNHKATLTERRFPGLRNNLDEMRGLEPGWYDGTIGDPILDEHLDWLIHCFEANWPTRTPLPDFAPCPDGTVSGDWCIGQHCANITIDPTARRGDLVHFILPNSDDYDGAEFDLTAPSEWGNLAGLIDGYQNSLQ